jgi:malonate decarboxylase beta subunit
MTSALIAADPVTELTGRDRARALLDTGTFRELVDPFEQLISPHLAVQNITPQSDDGLIVAQGTLGGERALVLAFDGAFQGGGLGEVNGAKIAGALELALADWESGRAIRPVICFETGGIRLQEANLGMLAISEIHAAIAALRRHTPVVGVIGGMIGCYGGMSIAAGLCTDLVMTAEGRLALNGPEVIEQEAGVAELDAKDRAGLWAFSGGRQRTAVGLADVLVADDTAAVREAVLAVFARDSRPDAECRSARISFYQTLVADDTPLSPEGQRATWSAAAKEQTA